MVRIGAHVDQTDPLAAAAAKKAEVVQFFLGDPQGWKAPVLPERHEEIRDADVDVYVHSPYVVNVATSNNRIRIPSRKILTQQLEGAAKIGAKGLIVHGGHVLKNDDPQLGFENWRKVFERMETPTPVPVLIENTAGGDNAMARMLERIARLWDALDGFDVGFCLDTCHAHAGGNDLGSVVAEVLKITGRVDLVHANDSRDAFGSGADRHTSLGQGQIDPVQLAAVVRDADAPVVCETPGGAAEHKADFAWLRDQVEQLDQPAGSQDRAV
jgi:deoxyribonuclease IV